MCRINCPASFLLKSFSLKKKIQAVGKSLSSDLKLGYSGARTQKPTTYAERYEMSHRPASLPDFQPNGNSGFGIESHFGGTVQPTKPQQQYQR